MSSSERRQIRSSLPTASYVLVNTQIERKEGKESIDEKTEPFEKDNETNDSTFNRKQYVKIIECFARMYAEFKEGAR